jgi:hypothetical protein
MIYDRFLRESAQEIDWNPQAKQKFNKFPLAILLPFTPIFADFLQDPATFPLLSCRILRGVRVAVICDLRDMT